MTRNSDAVKEASTRALKELMNMPFEELKNWQPLMLAILYF